MGKDRSVCVQMKPLRHTIRCAGMKNGGERGSAAAPSQTFGIINTGGGVKPNNA